MRSCPYAKSVLFNYKFVNPAGVNASKITFNYEKTLFLLKVVVYQFDAFGTEFAKLNVWYFCKDNILSTYNIVKIHLFASCFYNFLNCYYICGHGSQNLMVFVLFLLRHVKIIHQNKCKIKLNIYNNNTETAKYKNIDLIYPKGQDVNGFAIFYTLLQYYIESCICELKYQFVKVIDKLNISNALTSSNTKSDMEVDEKSQELKESINGQMIKEEHLNYNFELEESKNEYLTVINDVQNMKESECTQVKNSFNCNNHNEKIDIKNNINNEVIANEDLIKCVGNDNSDFKLNLVKDVASTVVDNTALTSVVKKEEPNFCNEVNVNDSFTIHKVNENEIAAEGTEKNNDKNLNNCDSKTSDCNTEKDKAKGKDNSGNNNVAGQTTLLSSTSTTKKTDDQSSQYHSSSSNSSSRSKYKDYKSSSHRSSSSSKNSERSKSNDQERSRHGSDKKKSRSCHHKSDEKCHCKSHHHSRHHSKKSKKCQSVKTQCTADEIAYELRGGRPEISNPYFTRVPWVPHPQLANLKYGRYYRIEVDRNGGASIVHLYMDEINHLNESQMKECAVEFIKLSYSEDENECAYHVMGIVHGAAAYLPDLVDYMADHYPTLTVKTGSLASRDNHTTTMSQYRDEVYKTYSNGTFRYAPLDQLSICGVLGEEVGAYFPDFVARLEQSPFMKPVMPWSSLSVVETDNPRESNDGPIFWVRPGEQMLPANEALKESARPKKRRNNELDNLAYIAGSRSSEARESLFMDRTKAHADQVGVDYGLSNTAPTAAVGVLKSVNCGHPEHGNRATKDVVAFHAQDYNELLEILMLDLYEPPQTQCTKWVEVSKLNTLRREGIRYAHVQLHDNDVYYLPRKIIHQFQTISSVASVAWHIRYKDYFSIMGAPNLHTPTGINKGQVFYEKKNVAVYYPPVCENEILASVTNTPGSPLSKTPKKYDKLKDYSPFKHSPRKNHKVHSPRTSSKKEKGSESMPQTPNKKESRSASNDEEKKTSNGKKDHGKSDDASDSGSKRERENTSSKRSDSNHSNDHSSAKKERKEGHESTSSHRKEVKNLQSDFDLKKIKGKSTKSFSKSRSEKSGHHNKRSDNSSSRHKRRDESKSKFLKHEKNSSHKKEDKNFFISNGHVVENSVKSDDKHERNISLKRKNSDSQDSFSSKKTKEESLQNTATVIENGGDRHCSTFEEKRTSESEISSLIVSDVEIDPKICNRISLHSNESTDPETAETVDEDRTNIETEKNTNTVSNFELESEVEKNNVKNTVELDDLRQSTSFSCERLSSDINPPLPCTSPPSNPPLPPNSPGSDKPTESLCSTEFKEELSCPSSSPVTTSEINEESGNGTCNVVHSDISKDKNNDVSLQGKKFKKKILKKILKEENESYDLLGDIMSQMDKKK